MMVVRKLLFAALAMACAGCADDEQSAAPQPHWELSTEYVSDTMLKSDAAVAESLKYRQMVLLREGDLTRGVYSHYRSMAANMKLRPLPALYLDRLDARPLPQAAARLTREGHGSVILNLTALDQWTPRELVAVLGHELVHLKEHHVTAENLANAFNHPELSVAHELEADRVGSGPLGSCDPLALKGALQIVFYADRKDYEQKNPLVTDLDYESLTGIDHPNQQLRLAALDAMAADVRSGCR